MNLKFLRTFVTIADNAGFARAATQLNLTQSAASRQIQALEEELGMLLFVRVGRSSRLTPEGGRLIAAQPSPIIRRGSAWSGRPPNPDHPL
jgi:LysR family transcriptional regulator, cyn operon transcriptional activator